MNRGVASVLASLLTLGAAWHSSAAEPNKALVISISSEGRYALDGKPVEQQRLLTAIKDASGGRPFDLTISLAPQVKYELVGKAITVAHEAGVSGVRLVQTPPPEAAPSTPR